MWSWARSGYFQDGGALLGAAWKGALAYGAIWLAGLVLGFVWRRLQRGSGGETHTRTAAYEHDVKSVTHAGRRRCRGRMARHTPHGPGDACAGLERPGRRPRVAAGAGGISGVSRLPDAGGIGTHRSGGRLHVRRRARMVGARRRRPARSSRSRSSCSGRWPCSARTRSNLVRHQAAWFDVHESSVKTALSAAWAVFTGAGVLAGRSHRTAAGQGSWLLELAGTVAPVVFVFGYLLILASFIHVAVPQLAVAPWSAGSPRTFDLCEVEARLQARASATPLSAVLAAEEARGNAAWNPGCRPSLGMEESGVFAGLLVMLVGSVALAWLFSWRVNLNEFSLHTFYRNRLVRCFLGASRQRKPHPFTGFDAEDDALAAAQPRARTGAAALSDFQRRHQSRGGQEPRVAGAQGGVVRLHARVLRFRVPRRRRSARRTEGGRRARGGGRGARQKEEESGEVPVKARAAGIRPPLSAYARPATTPAMRGRSRWGSRSPRRAPPRRPTWAITRRPRWPSS